MRLVHTEALTSSAGVQGSRTYPALWVAIDGGKSQGCGGFDKGTLAMAHIVRAVTGQDVR